MLVSMILYIDGNEFSGLDHRTLRKVIIDCKPIYEAMQIVSAVFRTNYGHDRKQLVMLVDTLLGHNRNVPSCLKINRFHLLTGQLDLHSAL